MSKQKYLDMCKLMGDEIDFDKLPPDYEDFPSYVHTALEIFNALPDLYSGGMSPLYVGKDISSLHVLFDLHLITNQEDKMDIFEVVKFLDARARNQAIREAKREAAKAKAK